MQRGSVGEGLVRGVHANRPRRFGAPDKQLVVRCIPKLVLSHNKTVWAFLSVN